MALNDRADCHLLIAAPSSGSGKTTVTLGLLRALKRQGYPIRAAKAGPDFIDPGFHQLACGHACGNLDPWGMQPNRLKHGLVGGGSHHCIIEGMMGLFDGAADGSGSAASLAKLGSIPVVLIVDAAKQSHSIAALVRGFRDHDPELTIAGIILNKIGSSRHEAMLREALGELGMPVFGAIPRTENLVIPERHLGLVQAKENNEIDWFIEKVADVVEASVDLNSLLDCFRSGLKTDAGFKHLSKPGGKIAVAEDEAFSFCYPHMIDDFTAAGAKISTFSPLANESPATDATAVFLPGGYPELHAQQLAAADVFLAGLREARDRGVLIYGECGGYMVLGKGLIDADGKRHEMAGLLELETSFAERKLHLGYRQLAAQDFPLGDALTAHEFHYSTALVENGAPLFLARDALGNNLGKAGLRDGNVMGSYMHVIDKAEA